jgi:hypothetical protein
MKKFLIAFVVTIKAGAILALIGYAASSLPISAKSASMEVVCPICAITWFVR